jgi:hypothetical protein
VNHIFLPARNLRVLPQQVKEATHLPAVDWARNLQVCDFVNSRKDGPQQAVKALKKCMKHEDERVVGLALSLCDATIKNCGSDLHMALGTRDFLEAVEVRRNDTCNLHSS